MSKINIQNTLFGIAIGIKFRPNFAIEDKIGEIADELLYRRDSLFNYLVFPITTNAVGAKSLNNPDIGDNLIINNSNIILEINFSKEIKKEKANDLIEEFLKVVTEKIYKIVNIHDVYLVGIVKKYLINDSTKVNAISKYVNQIGLDNINDYNMSFTKKIILSDSKLIKDHNDYENAIHTIIKIAGKEEFILQVDYQHFYDPKLESIVDIKYKDFLGRVYHYNDDIICNWLNSYDKK